MKRNTFLFNLFSASICLTLLSCSKALTDIGYPPGPIGTHNANDVPLYINDFSDYPRNKESMALPIIGNVSFFKDGNPYIENTNMGGFNEELFEEATRQECELFLKNFYDKLLSKHFSAKHFNKKYRPLCTRDVCSLIDTLSTINPKYQGWQAFLIKGLALNSKPHVAYSKEAWFKVSADANPDTCILVQLIMPEINKPPKITGIRYIDTDQPRTDDLH